MIDFVRALLGAYCLGWLLAEALSSTWFVRVCAAALVGLVIADLFYHCGAP